MASGRGSSGCVEAGRGLQNGDIRSSVNNKIEEKRNHVLDGRNLQERESQTDNSTLDSIQGFPLLTP